ncbi:hypothetical protein GIB67_008504 [Kingdonia uniflora]|uniref:J domain-containing protein n=1 Tax=Kingdonia uniflora TaxID=39325 RepID=A0A7J7LFC5_9MAGN|nr:hypothetical protein GIB67_008504 [Kingdonia uniflora]
MPMSSTCYSSSSLTHSFARNQITTCYNIPRCHFRVSAFANAETTIKRRAAAAANLYEILRVSETASRNEIKTAYRSLAKRFHPDASTLESDGCDFMEIHKAYATLSDQTARDRYDASIGADGSRRGSSFVGKSKMTRRWETDQCW